MPSLGADMEAGTLVEWLKSPGDHLVRGDIIAVVETQKGAIEIEVFEDGVLSDVLVQPGEEVPVGQPLALIRGAAEAQPAIDLPPAVPTPQSPVPAGRERVRPLPPASTDTPRISPAARRLAERRSLDVKTIAPGSDGIIGLREVEAAGVAVPDRRPGQIDQIEMRRAIDSAMSRANRDIPHYYVSSTIDVTPMMDWLAAYNADRPVDERLLYAVPIVRAVALCLRDFEDLNGSFAEGTYHPASSVNLGIAIATRGGGLMTPAILETDTLDQPTLMAKLSDLVRRVRAGGLRSSELSMATATLTNLGEETADTLLPIIYPPQVSIIGCGQIQTRPWVIDGAIVPRQLIEITVAGDHRVSDGRRGAQFLRSLTKRLGMPEEL